MNLEFNATVTSIGSLETINEKLQLKKLIVQTQDTQYPQTYEIAFLNDRSKLLDNIAEGQTVTIKANLRGNKWEKGDRSGVALNLNGYYISEYSEPSQGE